MRVVEHDDALRAEIRALRKAIDRQQRAHEAFVEETVAALQRADDRIARLEDQRLPQDSLHVWCPRPSDWEILESRRARPFPPPSFVICDGTGGTPNLLGRFLKLGLAADGQTLAGGEELPDSPSP